MLGARSGPNRRTPTRSRLDGVPGASKPRIQWTCGAADAAEAIASSAPVPTRTASAIRGSLPSNPICDTAYTLTRLAGWLPPLASVIAPRAGHLEARGEVVRGRGELGGRRCLADRGQAQGAALTRGRGVLAD